MEGQGGPASSGGSWRGMVGGSGADALHRPRGTSVRLATIDDWAWILGPNRDARVLGRGRIRQGRPRRHYVIPSACHPAAAARHGAPASGGHASPGAASRRFSRRARHRASLAAAATGHGGLTRRGGPALLPGGAEKHLPERRGAEKHLPERRGAEKHLPEQRGADGASLPVTALEKRGGDDGRPTAGHLASANGGDFFFFAYPDSFQSDELTVSRCQLQVQEKMEPTPEDFVLKGVEGEPRSMTLQEYGKVMLPEGLILSDRPAGQDAQGHCPPRLCPEAQRIFYLTIQLIVKLLQLGRLPRSVSSQNIALTSPYYMPMLKQVGLIENPTDQQLDTTISQLADVFEELIRVKGGNMKLPAEIHNLLFLMRSPNTREYLPLIKVHSSMVPMENRGPLYVLEFQYIMDVVKVFEPSSYRYIVKEVVYKKDWDKDAEQNKYLGKIFGRGNYDLLAAKAPTSQVQQMKFHRHSPCHSLQDAADVRSPHGLRYTHVSINHALYAASEMLLASIQSSLHFLGHLEVLKTESFFWG